MAAAAFIDVIDLVALAALPRGCSALFDAVRGGGDAASDRGAGGGGGGMRRIAGGADGDVQSQCSNTCA